MSPTDPVLDRRAGRRQKRRWNHQLLVIAIGALVLRLGYVMLFRRHATPTGDAYFYHYQANLVAAGRGFINPLTFAVTHKVVPAADHPPLWTLVLALAALVGLKSFFSQIVWSCVVGTLAVVLVGLATREMAGARAGLAAAALGALYPVFWINDGALMSETLVLITVSLVIWQFYRLWHRPTLWGGLLLGACCGLATLTRSELVLVLIALTIAVGALGLVRGARLRIGLCAMTLLGALVVVAPWWIYNIPRFSDPVLLSSQLGVTLAGANCPATYSGPLMGYWSFACDLAVHPTPGSDASQQDYQYRRVAIDYAEHHEGRLLPVAAARLGRELGLYRPFQQIDLEWAVLGRPRLPATLGLFAWYVTAALAVGGVVVLRRRRVPLLPLVVITADVLIVAVVTFGQTRYRTALDAVVVMLAGVAVGALIERRGRDRRSTDDLTSLRHVPASVP